MTLQIITTDQVSVENGVKVLAYGRAGTGKTTLCASAPSPFIISAESGLLSLRRVKIPAAIINSYSDMQEAFVWVRDKAKGYGLKTICLDSVTEIAEQVLSVEKAKTSHGQQAYGGLIDEMIPLIKGFRDLPYFNVVFTAKETTVKNDVTGVVSRGPKMPGRTLGPELPYLFDEVFHTNRDANPDGTEYYYLRTRPDFMTEAKDRSGALDEFEYPNLTNIFNKIAGV